MSEFSGLPARWVNACLSDVCAKIVDGSHNPPPAQHTGLPMLSAKNIDGGIELDGRLIHPDAFALEDRRTQVRPGDVLLTIVGTIGRTAVVPDGIQPFTLQRSVAVLKPSGLDPKFLAYQLQTEHIQRSLYANARGTAQKGIYLNSLGLIEVRVAPLAEQTRIANTLDQTLSDLDAAITALERVRANLRRYRASVLKASVEGRLVRNEAELARKEGRDFEPASVLLDRILMERRRRWEESERDRMKPADKPPKNDRWKLKYREPVAPDASTLPQLPEGWCWSTIDQVSTDCLIGIDRGRQQEVSADIGHPYLRMNNLTPDGRIDLSKLSYVLASNDESLRFEISPGDILFNTRNSVELVGKTAIISQVPPGTLYNNNLMRIRISSNVVGSFVSGQMNSEIFKARLSRVKRATTNVAAIYAKDLLPLPIALPPFTEQARISSEISRLHSVTEAVAPVIELCASRCYRLRQSILKWAFEGKLVDQDPNDEPASVLVERIRAERATATTSTKYRKAGLHITEAAK